MTDDLDRKIVQPAARKATADRKGWWIWLVAGFFALCVAGLGVVLLSQHGQISELKTTVASQSHDKDVLSGQLTQVADQVRALGHIPVVTPPPPAAPQVIPGPGPTQAQIDAAVAARLAEHPPPAGQNATPAMVATVVADFLTAHPPQPGRPPTAEEIATAASTYITEHAADFRGQAGASGTNGKDATDAQVQATVAAYCDAHGSCAGPAGKAGADGPQGVSITDLTFARDSSGQCQVIVTLHDPATGKDAKITHSAGDAACPLITGAPLVRHN